MRSIPIVVAVATALPGAAAHGGPPVSSTQPFESSEPHKLPFATRAKWLDFVRSALGGAAAASRYEQLFSAADYDRYRDGAKTRATRFRYRSDGLVIRGLMVAPRTPGPHPVILYNHGGVMQWGRIIVPEVLEFHRLAERGYLVLATTYRGEGQRGATEHGRWGCRRRAGAA